MNPSSTDAAVGVMSVPTAARGEAQPATEHLLFVCQGIACAAPLSELREVLRTVPPSVRMPFSPAWLLGVFTLRTDLLGLVDPAPMLLGATWAERTAATLAPVATLIVGYSEPLLGLAVGPIGEIVAIHPDEIEVSAPLDDANDASAAPSYIRGHYQPTGASERYAVVELAPFVAALLRALREGADHA